MPIFPTILFVNGYGAAEPKDENYNRYLSEVYDTIRSRPSFKFRIFLAGGYTNRTDLTEARAMLNWFEAKGNLGNAEFVLIENSTTARDNMNEFAKLVGDEPVAIFCEFSRRYTMRFFAFQHFQIFKICGIRFDARSLKPKHQLEQVLFRTPLEVLAWYWKPADKLRLKLRAKHVAEVRKATSS